MTGMPSASVATPDSSLLFVLDYIEKNDITEPKIWATLDRTDRTALASLLSEVDNIDSEVYDKLVHVGVNAKQFETSKSGRKGKVFEKVAETLFKDISCFGTRTDIPTATNQLDVLVQMGPMRNVVPTFKKWGTHFICECKFHDKGVSVDWVQKLHAVLTTHGASVGILISKKPISKGTRGNIHHMLQMFALNGHIIISISRDDLDKCASGLSIIPMLCDRYSAVQMGISYFMKPSI
jgi:hypothetical protein